MVVKKVFNKNENKILLMLAFLVFLLDFGIILGNYGYKIIHFLGIVAGRNHKDLYAQKVRGRVKNGRDKRENFNRRR